MNSTFPLCQLPQAELTAEFSGFLQYLVIPRLQHMQCIF